MEDENKGDGIVEYYLLTGTRKLIELDEIELKDFFSNTLKEKDIHSQSIKDFGDNKIFFYSYNYSKDIECYNIKNIELLKKYIDNINEYYEKKYSKNLSLIKECIEGDKGLPKKKSCLNGKEIYDDTTSKDNKEFIILIKKSNEKYEIIYNGDENKENKEKIISDKDTIIVSNNSNILISNFYSPSIQDNVNKVEGAEEANGANGAEGDKGDNKKAEENKGGSKKKRKSKKNKTYRKNKSTKSP